MWPKLSRSLLGSTRIYGLHCLNSIISHQPAILCLRSPLVHVLMYDASDQSSCIPPNPNSVILLFCRVHDYNATCPTSPSAASSQLGLFASPCFCSCTCSAKQWRQANEQPETELGTLLVNPGQQQRTDLYKYELSILSVPTWCCTTCRTADPTCCLNIGFTGCLKFGQVASAYQKKGHYSAHPY